MHLDEALKAWFPPPMRVLVADDEKVILQVLSRCLTTWGYTAVPAEDGLKAWRILSEPDPPRIVILDWDMPGISGIKICRMLRESPSGGDAYILLLTARQKQTDLIEGLEAGADDFISKPFDLRELQLRLAKGVSTYERRTTMRHSGAPPSGTALGGKFRLERKIGEGGMASVWLGVHLSLGINVAVKMMKPEFTRLAEYANFESEARAAAKLRSQHIVRVFDHGMTTDGSPYLVMEYLDGETLWDRIARDGPLPRELVIALVSQMAAALGEAHEHGIVHRDVKPENIVLIEDAMSPGGFVAKLVDFGLARPNLPDSTDAVTGGTLCYMSPEHLRGTSRPGPAQDLWALAATAFTAMTEKSPFDGKSLTELAYAISVTTPPRPSSVNPRIPASVDKWFLRACAHDPAERYPTAAALADAFMDAWAQHSTFPASSRRGAPISATPHSLAPTEPHAPVFTSVEIAKSSRPPTVRAQATSTRVKAKRPRKKR